MKLTFVFFIILLLSFSSCQKEYPIYQEEGKKIAQLLSIDEEIEVAYLEAFTSEGIKENYQLYEKISKFYNIEGYFLRIYNTRTLERLKNLGKEMKLSFSDYESEPYSYRLSYIKNNDTIAVALYHKDRTALYTPKKYTLKDKDILKEILDTLHLSNCVLYNKPIDVGRRNLYTRYDDCYAIYNYKYAKGDWLFIDNATKGAFFTIDNDVQVRIMENEELYIKYFTSKRLNKEQIMKVISLNNEYENKITYFVSSWSTDDGYANYQKTNGGNMLFMFDDNKTYKVMSNNNGTFNFELLK